MIQIHDITNTVFTSKTYILYKNGCNKAWLVDIGDIAPVVSFLNEQELQAEGVFLTHAHFDHIYGIEELTKRFPNCKVYVQEYAKQALASEKLNMSKYHGAPINYTGDNIEILHEGDRKSLFEGEPEMFFYETPGHNPGCLTMVVDDKIFTGDSYIPNIGVNTIPPHSSRELALKSMERILSLAKDKEIYSGHHIDF